MRRLSAFILSLCLGPAFAAQVYQTQDGGEVSAYVSSDGLSRITLKSDRIKNIKGISGDYQIDKDELRGDIYIKPGKEMTGSDISLFVTSEKGQTYHLNLSVSDSESQTIEIINSQLIKAADSKKSKASGKADELAVLALIKAGYNQNDLKSYVVKDASKPKKLKIDKKISMTIEKEYIGKRYQMEVIRVENKSVLSKTISEQNFIVNGRVVAVAADSLIIPAKSYTNVYVVYKR